MPRPCEPIQNERKREPLFRQQKLIVRLEVIKRQSLT